MINEINNDVPTVYLLHNGQSVYVTLEGDGSIQKITNKVVREKDTGKLAYGTKTVGFANHFNSVFNQKAVTDGYNVTSVRSMSIFGEKDQLVINMQQGQNCIIGMLDQNDDQIKAGYMFSTFSAPVSHSDHGIWEYSLSAEKTNAYSEAYGQTDLQKVAEYFAQAQQQTEVVEADFLSPIE